jgi:hypothetical protein
MPCNCGKNKVVNPPQPTPVPQTPEQYHAQQLTEWGNNLDDYHFIKPTHNED